MRRKRKYRPEKKERGKQGPSGTVKLTADDHAKLTRKAQALDLFAWSVLEVIKSDIESIINDRVEDAISELHIST